MVKRITIRDIALEAGVAKSTVSFVLNDRSGRVPISEATRNKVMEVVERYHYQPNPMARSLTTRQTGHLSFILSDDMQAGFANAFFASCLNGAEAECRLRGYALNVGLFNLSCVDSFIFPTSVRQHSVDGVILAGYVADEILDKFSANNLPCVCIGDYMPHPERVTTVANAVTESTLELVRYLYRKGHRRIALHYPTFSRDLQEVANVKEILAKARDLADCHTEFLLTPEHHADYSAAGVVLEQLFQFSPAERPTALIASDQTVLAILGELRKRNLRCPQDLALAATADTMLCEFSVPPVTAMHYDLASLGEYAVKLLLDHILEGKPLTSQQSKNDFRGTIIERESV